MTDIGKWEKFLVCRSKKYWILRILLIDHWVAWHGTTDDSKFLFFDKSACDNNKNRSYHSKTQEWNVDQEAKVNSNDKRIIWIVDNG